ncbi:MAG TPA: ABC transporter ATP-binding protein [Lachnospiraceae bacterium]|jgi:energy-coupling factor transport system ATP-binding protein|nr:ABC transporter ATP-binding protein [Lachnospiraceae bacterium]
MKPVIEFKDVTFQYKVQTKPTLHDINLTIYEGEKVLILGPSGSGKSTLAGCINGVVPFLESGKITGSCKVNGVETSSSSVFNLSECVGTVLQDSDAQFVGITVGEDIAFSLENKDVPRPEMLSKVLHNATIVGMEDFLGQVPYSLSGGQKQKVALAGVMNEDVNILIFDEPLAALDPQMGMTAVDLIDHIAKETNKTTIIIEHRLEDVLYRHVDRIVLMAEGHIVADVTPEELLRSKLLEENGIRNPLYLTAMKYAGCDLKEQESIADIYGMELTENNKAKLCQFFGQDAIEKEASTKDEIIRIEDVSFSYDGTIDALNNASCTIREGEKVAFIGKNGAGKTTLARVICGFYRPLQGKIFLKGENYLNYSIKEIGERIGYVMQNPNQMLVKDIIIEEVQTALRLRGYSEEEMNERVEKTLRMCDLYKMRNWPVSSISYGQKKRVTVAAILALEPDTIILDEPTAGQDYKHYTEIMDFINQLNKEFGITVILITHDMHLAIEYTDRAVVFSDSEIIADDKVFKVLSDDSVIKKANLKQTSLYELAMKIGMAPEKCISRFISYEREVGVHE